MELGSSSLQDLNLAHFIIRISVFNASGSLAVLLNTLNIIVLNRNYECFGETTTVFAMAMHVE